MTGSVRERLREGAEILAPSRTALLDAELLLAEVLGRDRARLLARPQQDVGSAEAEAYHMLLARRALGEPVAHLRRRVEWFGFELEVGPAVLIPRPETEFLVETALGLAPGAGSIADIGTGSGSIALAVALQRPEARVVATDVSLAALTVARRNACRLHLQDRINFRAGSLLDPLAEMPDLLIANLPYLSDDLMRTLPADVRFEPPLALYGGPDGLDVYRELIAQLKTRGWQMPLAIEIDHNQSHQARNILAGLGEEVAILTDYAGLDRIATFTPL